MATDLIRYDLIVQEAMARVMRKVLAKSWTWADWPGEHHFNHQLSHRRGRREDFAQTPAAMAAGDDHHPAAPIFPILFVRRDGFRRHALPFRSIPETLYIPYAFGDGVLRSFGRSSASKFNL